MHYYNIEGKNGIFAFLRFTRQCRSTSYLMWHSKVSFDFLINSNISAKNNEIHSHVSRVITSEMWDVFLDTVYASLQVQHARCWRQQATVSVTQWTVERIKNLAWRCTGLLSCIECILNWNIIRRFIAQVSALCTLDWCIHYGGRRANQWSTQSSPARHSYCAYC